MYKKSQAEPDTRGVLSFVWVICRIGRDHIFMGVAS